MPSRVRDWSGDGDGREERTPTAARLYTEGLRALARREQTTQQLRAKLLRLGGRASDVQSALARLTDEGALDDRRAARIYAQTAFRVRKRTAASIEQELARLGIGADLAREIVAEVCGPDVERQRLEQAIIHGLRGGRREHREQDARRLFASLVRQGYDAEDIRRALARAGVDDLTDT